MANRCGGIFLFLVTAAGCGAPSHPTPVAADTDSAHVVARARTMLDSTHTWVVYAYVRGAHGVIVEFDVPIQRDSAGIRLCLDCGRVICVPHSGTPVLLAFGPFKTVPPTAACRDSVVRRRAT
jgi:hypothetical protein